MENKVMPNFMYVFSAYFLGMIVEPLTHSPIITVWTQIRKKYLLNLIQKFDSLRLYFQT
jgi:hypothetical protein